MASSSRPDRATQDRSGKSAGEASVVPRALVRTPVLEPQRDQVGAGGVQERGQPLGCAFRLAPREMGEVKPAAAAALSQPSIRACCIRRHLGRTTEIGADALDLRGVRWLDESTSTERSRLLQWFSRDSGT